MFRRHITLFAGLISLSATATLAQAATGSSDGFFFSPYLGADYQYMLLNYKKLPGTNINIGDILSDSLSGGDVHAGVRIHKYFGLEASYIKTQTTKKYNVLGTGTDTKVDFRGPTLDAMGYLPIGDTRLEIIGTVGASFLRGHEHINTDGSSGNASEANFRFGGGAQYWLTDHLNARALVRYQAASFDNLAKDAVLSTIGLNYQF